MRVEGSVTAISWIPSEAIEGLPKLPFEVGVGTTTSRRRITSRPATWSSSATMPTDSARRTG